MGTRLPRIECRRPASVRDAGDVARPAPSQPNAMRRPLQTAFFAALSLPRWAPLVALIGAGCAIEMPIGNQVKKLSALRRAR